MNDGRIGRRAIRALRHSRDWTQSELGLRVGCSAAVVSRIERGNLKACSLSTVDRILEALGARLVMYVDWRGGELDRLRDADHALLQERWARRKQGASGHWESRQEVTYNHYGERGSIDDLAFHPPSGTLLVSELKTGIYDAQRMLAKMDEKDRLARDIAQRFGWDVRRVIRGLVVADTSTNRRRIRDHAALFASFDCRGRAANAWLENPVRDARGLLVFLPLSDLRGTHGRRAGRRRVRHSAVR